MKNKLTIILTIIFSTLFIILGYYITKNDVIESVPQEFSIATVTKVEEKFEKDVPSANGNITETHTPFTAKITSGYKKGAIVEATQLDESGTAFKKKIVEVNDKVLITYSPYDNNNQGGYIFVDYNKIPAIIFLILLFLALIIIIGKFKGLATILSLLFTCLSIFFIYIPGIIKGFNIYYLTIIVSFYIIVVSLILINGLNKKTICAILGNFAGIIITGALALFFNYILKITGLIDTDYIFLTLLNPDHPIDLKALVWGGIIIGAIGAIMDVSMSISSSMNELAEHMKEKSFIKMFKSGMNIGKDIIGTMTNTLILAYIGSSIATVLLLSAYSKNLYYIFNLEMIVTQITQSIIGSIGILVAVPTTTIVASYLFNKKINNNK